MHRLHLILHMLSLKAVEGDIMSKYIPGNHKNLTAADRLYIERQLNAGSSFKDIARYLCKDPSTISKEVRSHRLSDFNPGRGLFLNAKTSVSIVSTVKRRMSVERSSSAALSVLPALPVTSIVRIL